MIEVIQEATGKILRVKIISIYDHNDAEVQFNKFIKENHNVIKSIEISATKYGRIMIFYYAKLESEDNEPQV